jgi:hypothetical protein
MTSLFRLLFFKIVPEHVRSQRHFLLKWLLVGLLVRLLIAPFLVSTDSVVILWRSYIVAHNHALVPMGDPPLISLIIAPLLVTFVPSISLRVFGDVISTSRFSPFTASIPLRMSYDGVPALLIVYKIPFLVMDLALAFLLLRFFDDGKKASLAFKFWCINPITIFITLAVGQYDIFPVFFMMLAFYFLKSQRLNWSGISLGIASVFKLYALPLLFPIAAIYSKQQHSQKSRIFAFLRICGMGLIPVIIGLIASLVIPTYYESVNAAFSGFEYYNGFYGSQLFIPWYKISSPFLANLFIFVVDFSFKLQLFQGVEIYVVFVAYAFFLFASVFYERWNFSKVWKATLIFFLMYYAFSYFHAQWFLWGQPFLILIFVENRKLRKLFPFFILLFFIYIFYWDAALTTNLLIPVLPQAWLWPGPLSILNGIGLPGIQILNIFRSFLSAICIFVSFIVLKELARTRNKPEKGCSLYS